MNPTAVRDQPRFSSRSSRTSYRTLAARCRFHNMPNVPRRARREYDDKIEEDEDEDGAVDDEEVEALMIQRLKNRKGNVKRANSLQQAVARRSFTSIGPMHSFSATSLIRSFTSISRFFLVVFFIMALQLLGSEAWVDIGKCVALREQIYTGDLETNARLESRSIKSDFTSVSALSHTTSDGDDSQPTPFDSISRIANLTAECSRFLNSVASDPKFKQCSPLSGLLRDSNGFFQTMKKGAFAITVVLDSSCSVNLPDCTALMDQYGGRILYEGNCGSDYKRGNPVVHSVHTALVVYRPLYAAGCLSNIDGSYCFVDAATNIDSPEDFFVYSLPFGIQLSNSSTPTCTDCLAKTMAIFNTAAGNRTLPLSRTYESAARIINTACGENFVNVSVEVISCSTSIILEGTRLPLFAVTFTVMIIMSTPFLFF